MEDPRLKFFKAINLDESRISQFPGIIFVCGGPRNDLGDPPTSARDFIVRSLFEIPSHKNIAQQITEAEQVQDWLKEGHYSNLIAFETDIADLATLIVLFVESAGSIAELGAFSVIPEIASKLIVFIRENSYQQDSFIRLGPIKHLEEIKSSVKVYPWTLTESFRNYEFGPADIASVEKLKQDICGDISTAISKVTKRPSFSKNLPGHIMLLICDLVDISLALKQGEIFDYVNNLGIPLTEKALKKYLYLLEKFKLLEKKSYGDHYYIATNSSAFISFKFEEPKPTHDRLTIKADMAIYYRENDRSRHRALRNRSGLFESEES